MHRARIILLFSLTLFEIFFSVDSANPTDIKVIIKNVPEDIIQEADTTGEWLKPLVNKMTDEKRFMNQSLTPGGGSGGLSIAEDVSENYPETEFEVQTEDEYLLKMYRINTDVNKKKPVAFLMHGLIDSSDGWTLLGTEKSLAYMLAKAGYDVWMGNARGNKYCRTHLTKSRKSLDFWDFSWEEIGYYDLPAMIDFVLNKTNQTDLYYAGHSQGTTSFFVMCAMRPEYNKKIKVMVALAPIAFMSRMVSPLIRLISPFTKQVNLITRRLGRGEFLPSDGILVAAGRELCLLNDFWNKRLCYNTMFIICGFDSAQIDDEALDRILPHVPAGSSVRQFLHYGQGVISKDFRRYDFSNEENQRRYGTQIPPSYNLSEISAPVALFYSDNDWLAEPSDVLLLHSKLRNALQPYKIPFPLFNHLDYLWARNVDTLVNKKVLEVFSKH